MSTNYIDSNVFIYAIIASEVSEKKALYCKKVTV